MILDVYREVVILVWYTITIIRVHRVRCRPDSKIAAIPSIYLFTYSTLQGELFNR